MTALLLLLLLSRRDVLLSLAQDQELAPPVSAPPGQNRMESFVSTRLTGSDDNKVLQQGEEITSFTTSIPSANFSPTSKPTRVPFVVPISHVHRGLAGTASPTSADTLLGTEIPSQVPTIVPSSSFIPSAAPSAQPTNRGAPPFATVPPTRGTPQLPTPMVSLPPRPSVDITEVPRRPTYQPTGFPSASPSVSSRPSFQPSMITHEPTSVKPTDEPRVVLKTDTPSRRLQVSSSPTAKPSASPVQQMTFLCVAGGQTCVPLMTTCCDSTQGCYGTVCKPCASPNQNCRRDSQCCGGRGRCVMMMKCARCQKAGKRCNLITLPCCTGKCVMSRCPSMMMTCQKAGQKCNMSNLPCCMGKCVMSRCPMTPPMM